MESEKPCAHAQAEDQTHAEILRRVRENQEERERVRSFAWSRGATILDDLDALLS